jgi:hypothetical protein
MKIWGGEDGGEYIQWAAKKSSTLGSDICFSKFGLHLIWVFMVHIYVFKENIRALSLLPKQWEYLTKWIQLLEK